jgi:membrane associated rhomboid family serine protease
MGAGMSADSEATPEAHAEVPTCFRHPDRETYVRCVRCDRPICPDCMREAAVGHQCVECVREANRDRREARTVFGGRVATGSHVTFALLAINAVIFVVELASPQVKGDFAMVPAAVALDAQWYRLLSSAFLHYGFFHILLNLWALYVIGQPLESWLGRIRFATLYLLSALGGSTLIYLVGDINQPVGGASGAIFGLFGAMFVMARRLQFDTRAVAILIVLNLLITFTVPGISWQGHLGGLIVGSALGAAFAYAPRGQRTPVQVLASLGVGAVLVAALLLRTPMIAAQYGLA